MAKVKPYGHIWALEFNRYACFSNCGNRTIFGWDIIANSLFYLEKSRSRSQWKSTKNSSGNLQVRADNRAQNERNPKSCSKVIAWTRISGRRRRRRNRYKKIKSPPVYRGDLIRSFGQTLWPSKLFSLNSYSDKHRKFNSLSPGGCGSNFTSVFFKLILWTDIFSTSCGLGLKWVSQNPTDNSTLVHIMALCCQQAITLANVDQDHNWAVI